MTERIAFELNGRPATIEADPAMPLLYALRAELGLNNPHFGCGGRRSGRLWPLKLVVADDCGSEAR